ncbi:hypothetical protein BKA00_006414 [Actinomadura coerulea]|uniref:Uncharacterized protein n=1 Tax=Actinomadura coerulea TaxID=46159 RepID=A0A7X0G4V2_9ACTN|nr:DUF6098 family protein [Actinomadura coerulea]MBB6399500.1 hypothetical protein [Actinomadura coerulea]GGQ13308.1 hypothetical protein GCM10010187_32070 [Actinomadura coerulea]
MGHEVITSLEELAELLEARSRLFVRWSADPAADQSRPHSKDGLTGAELPGLSANPLAVEPWWGDRSTVLWVARRLHDYSHLERARTPGARPWVLAGEEVGRGPDNEPIVTHPDLVALVDKTVLDQAEELLERDTNGPWGPLARAGG